MKEFSTFVILLLALAIVLSVLELKNLREALVDEKDGRSSQLFSYIFDIIASFGQTLISAVVGLIRLLLILIVNFFNGIFIFLASSITSPNKTTTSTTTIAAPATTSDVASSPLPTTPRMVSTATTTVHTPSTSATVPTTSTSVAASSSTATSLMTPARTITTTTASTTGTTTSTTTPAPPDLPRVVFVTNDTFTGNLGGVAGADKKCSSAAAGASLNGTFLPWISDATVSPDSRFIKSESPYILVNGMTIAANYSDLVANGPLLTINITEFGDGLPFGGAWTGTLPNGSAPNLLEPIRENCDGWTNNTFSTGLAGAFNSQPGPPPTTWTVVNFIGCFRFFRLYCFQQ